MGQASHHQSSHRGIDERFARGAEPLVILAQATALPKPAEGALHHPAARQHAAEALRPQCLPIDDGTYGRPNATWFRGMPDDLRSEEHTSELQSRQYLVCRL